MITPGELGISRLPPWLELDFGKIIDSYHAERDEERRVSSRTYRQLCELQPDSWYWALAQSDRLDRRTGRLMRLTVLNGREGDYFWQLVGQIPATGIWRFRTHSEIRTPIAMIRSYASVDYQSMRHSRPQIRNDYRVLHVMAQRGPQLMSNIRRNSCIKNYDAVRASVGRLISQRLVARLDNDLFDLREPPESEVELWKFRNPFVARIKSKKTASCLSDATVTKRIKEIVRHNQDHEQRGTSQRELKASLPIGWDRLSRVIDDLVARNVLLDRKSSKGRYFLN